MPDFQSEKALVRDFHAEIGRSEPDVVADVLARHTSSDWHWRGMHPFHEQARGRGGRERTFWAPFLTAMTRAPAPSRHLHGRPERDRRLPVRLGRHDGPPDGPTSTAPGSASAPPGKIAMLRFVEFHKVVGGRIAETAHCPATFPHLMIQAGPGPVPAADRRPPDPARPHDPRRASCGTRQDAATGVATLAAINAMIGDMGDRREEDGGGARSAPTRTTSPGPGTTT